VKMQDLKVYFVVCALLFTSLIIQPGSPLAADLVTPHGKVDAAVVKKVEWELRALAKKLSELENKDKETIFPLLANHLWKNPDIHGAAFACAPEVKEGKEIRALPYVYRSGDKLIQKDLGDRYDYTAPEHQWYAKPVKLGRPVWSEPSFDKSGGEVWMATYSMPVYSTGTERRLLGVVTSDVLLSGE
jgi:phosphoserine phosphatase RsbU/P